ncbi:MAG: TlyA family RNA methyltransferase [Chthoniobacterales bacterium]
MNDTMARKARLDLVLVDRGLFTSREQARRAVMAGEIRIGDRIVDKPSLLVDPSAAIAATAAPEFVSRGGVKLAGALDQLQLDVRAKVALDLGASTGGFTDCLLKRGVARVYAIDVGHGQMAWKIRQDARVIVREKLNARFLSRMDVPEPIDITVIDVSFISLTLVLPNAFQLSTPDGVILALIKPQFELQRQDVERGGIVSDPALHEKAQAKIRDFIVTAGLVVERIVPSVITGTDGNQEFFVCARKPSA